MGEVGEGLDKHQADLEKGSRLGLEQISKCVGDAACINIGGAAVLIHAAMAHRLCAFGYWRDKPGAYACMPLHSARGFKPLEESASKDPPESSSGPEGHSNDIQVRNDAVAPRAPRSKEGNL